MIIGTSLLGISTTPAQLLVGRIMTGVGNGFNFSTIPTYQSEHCKERNCAMLLSMQGTITIIGQCIAYCGSTLLIDDAFRILDQWLSQGLTTVSLS